VGAKRRRIIGCGGSNGLWSYQSGSILSSSGIIDHMWRSVALVEEFKWASGLCCRKSS
jgi:hypothetical protein